MTKTLDDFFGTDNNEACASCGTTKNLTVHFGMNEQTGKYALHYCTSCNAKLENEQAARNTKRNDNTNRAIAIAETDN